MVGEFNPSLRINLLSVEWMTNSPPFGAIGRDFRDEKVIRHPRTTTGAMVFKTPSGVGFRVGESQGLHLNGLAARSIPGDSDRLEDVFGCRSAVGVLD